MSRFFPPSVRQPLAVTTNLNINFLRKPGKGDLIADARLMKVGKRLAVGEVTIYSDGRVRAGRPCHLDLFDSATPLISRW